MSMYPICAFCAHSAGSFVTAAPNDFTFFN